MSAVLPLKLTAAGKKSRLVDAVDFIGATIGGTGQVGYTTGDLLYASGSTALSKLGIGSTGQVLTVVAGVPAWSSSSSDDLTFTADAALIAGQVVYATAADHVGKAKADAASTSYVVGLAKAAISNGATGSVRTKGIVTLTTGEWDALAGTTGGLTYNTRYFLSATTAGLLTATCPTTAGQEACCVGIALSTTELLLMDTKSDPITL